MLSPSYRACGKFILVGEHFILYDRPALAMPWHDVQLTLTPTDNVPPVSDAIAQAWRHARERFGLAPTAGFPFALSSTIPQGAGFGSSAALCLSLIRAAADEAEQTLSVADQIREATALEALFHGRSSGLDPTVVAIQQPLHVHMGRDPRPFPWNLPGVGFVLSVSREQRKTAQAVARVREFAERSPARFATLCDTMSELVLGVEDAITAPPEESASSVQARGQELGAWLNRNQELLTELDISSPHLDALIHAARDAGAWGAKFTGAGMGGGMLALAPMEQLPALCDTLQRVGGQHTTICRPDRLQSDQDIHAT